MEKKTLQLKIYCFIIPVYLRGKNFIEEILNMMDVINEIYSAELDYKTGEKTVYSDLGIITLGKIIEKVTGKSLDDFCRDEIFIPLGNEINFF